LLLNALWAEDTDRWLHARCGRHTAGGGAQQLMRAASCGQPTEEAQHTLVVRRPTRYADVTQNLRGESDKLVQGYLYISRYTKSDRTRGT